MQPELLHTSVLCGDSGHSEGHDPSWVEMNLEEHCPKGDGLSRFSGHVTEVFFLLLMEFFRCSYTDA